LRILRSPAPSDPLWCDTPTVAESGVPGFDAVLRYGLVARPATPRPIIERLNTALRATLASEEVRNRLAIEGAEPLPVRQTNTLSTSTMKRPNGRRSSRPPARRRNSCPMNFEFTEETKAVRPTRAQVRRARILSGPLKRAHNPRFPFDVGAAHEPAGPDGITLPEGMWPTVGSLNGYAIPKS